MLVQAGGSGGGLGVQGGGCAELGHLVVADRAGGAHRLQRFDRELRVVAVEELHAVAQGV